MVSTYESLMSAAVELSDCIKEGSKSIDELLKANVPEKYDLRLFKQDLKNYIKTHGVINSVEYTIGIILDMYENKSIILTRLNMFK